MSRTETDAFFGGVLVTLAIVYEFDEETVAEEIVRRIGPSSLLRVAKVNEEPCLPRLRKTVREVIRLRKIRSAA